MQSHKKNSILYDYNVKYNKLCDAINKGYWERKKKQNKRLEREKVEKANNKTALQTEAITNEVKHKYGCCQISEH